MRKKKLFSKFGTILCLAAFLAAGATSMAGTSNIQSYLNYDYNEIPFIDDSATAITCVAMNSDGYPRNGYAYTEVKLYKSSTSYNFNSNSESGIDCMEPGSIVKVKASSSYKATSYHKGTFNKNNTSSYPYATDSLVCTKN